MGEGDTRGEDRGLAAGGDEDAGRDSRGASFADDSSGAGERGERGGEGVPGDKYLEPASPFTLTEKLWGLGGEDLGDPY
ncbi:hypothetical protein VI817_004196 [Penicillium citrinum]|nr:hypothetical protein VI817_004196 [Penicillium citrinum]